MLFFHTCTNYHAIVLPYRSVDLGIYLSHSSQFEHHYLRSWRPAFQSPCNFQDPIHPRRGCPNETPIYLWIQLNPVQNACYQFIDKFVSIIPYKSLDKIHILRTSVRITTRSKNEFAAPLRIRKRQRSCRTPSRRSWKQCCCWRRNRRKCQDLIDK